MAYRIEFTELAQDHLYSLTARDRRIVIAGITRQLPHEPLRPTRNRKRLRPNPIAPWELRVTDMRVFYDVADADRIVSIVAIGRKRGNMVTIAGEEVQLEGD